MDFGLVDVEVQSVEQIEYMRRSKHTFDFLKEGRALEIGLQNAEIRKALSMKRMAREGFDRHVLNASLFLHKKLSKR